MSTPTIGVPWFAPADYQKLLKLTEDPNEIPASYHLWLQRAIRQHESLRRSGYDVVLVSIDADEFVEWCGENDHSPSASTKRLYADYLFTASAATHAGRHWEDARRYIVARI